ncbi:DUF4239 domain-containing protein [Duganella sp. FT50W]|uniref:DUF4239 domain-containing protein n=1 Tax=Duganella lactea TaxID=2692173 RepID=A0A6L8MM86_9BURK|nr:DUF4239 domain-containing protein [Duganella lactea]MYM82936.1 DUF4239 domain-containing protein [Duganella lactea]
MLDLLYNYPGWQVGTVIVIVPMILVCLMLKLFDKLIPHESRLAHNEFTANIISVIGINYAVLIAFVAVAVWGSFDKASAVANTEADVIGNMYHDAPGLGHAAGVELRMHLKDYVDTVVTQEWPEMAQGHSPNAGWRPLDDIQDMLARYHAQSNTESVYLTEILKNLNQVYDARRGRLSASEAGVEPVVWAIVLLGTCLTIGFTFLFGMPSLRMHMVMTGGFTAAAMLVLVLIIALDWPFRGEVQVQPSMFMRTQATMHRLDLRPMP